MVDDAPAPQSKKDAGKKSAVTRKKNQEAAVQTRIDEATIALKTEVSDLRRSLADALHEDSSPSVDLSEIRKDLQSITPTDLTPVTDLIQEGMKGLESTLIDIQGDHKILRTALTGVVGLLVTLQTRQAEILAYLDPHLQEEVLSPPKQESIEAVNILSCPPVEEVTESVPEDVEAEELAPTTEVEESPEGWTHQSLGERSVKEVKAIAKDLGINTVGKNYKPLLVMEIMKEQSGR